MTPAAASGQTRVALVEGWRVCATAPGRFISPESLGALASDDWISAARLGPVAAVLQEAGRWSIDGPARSFDAEDWWYCASFDALAFEPGERVSLGFDGLATIADVWLNGQHILHSDNMFVSHVCDATGLLKPSGNQLHIRFHALDAHLATKRVRPRWRTPMVAHQQLRWHRTTLLGRTPGWSPPVAPVGPVGAIWWEPVGSGACLMPDVHATIDDAGRGIVRASCVLAPSLRDLVERVELEVSRSEQVWRATLASADGGQLQAVLAIDAPQLWWPHTHGEPALHAARLVVHLRDKGAAPRVHAFAPIGFRRIEADTADGRFAVRVNGVPVFCRGACWTPLDVVSLAGKREAVQAAVAQVRDAGMNMLRVGGTMVYESDAFFEACDAQGVLVWQEFMFANMDYPEHDEHFAASVRTEAAQQLARWRGHACIAIVCGNSEVEQQAAMWGAPRELWAPGLFHATLREYTEAALPGVSYWPSSAHGGAFPHQPNAGTTSYYGVGAYLRPLDDARRSELAFATECLAFANVPEEAAIARMPGGQALRVHHPAWKQRTPRDLNAGWDFEDVRDHYLAALHQVDPVRLRAVDHDRYLALSRVVTGEVMARAFAEWRRPGSRCGGGLVWFLRDLWAGAGWGLLDDSGLPKPCFNVLKRALQPTAVFFTDEGLNGLDVHVVNERAEALSCVLALSLFGPGDAPVGATELRFDVPPRGGVTRPLAECLTDFTDVSYAYRFGPAPVTLVHAVLKSGEGQIVGEAFHLPVGQAPALPDIGLSARFDPAMTTLHVSSLRFAQHVHVAFDEHLPDDNEFHLAPGASRVVRLRRVREPSGRALKGSVWALNAILPVAISVPAT